MASFFYGGFHMNEICAWCESSLPSDPDLWIAVDGDLVCSQECESERRKYLSKSPREQFQEDFPEEARRRQFDGGF